MQATLSQVPESIENGNVETAAGSGGELTKAAGENTTKNDKACQTVSRPTLAVSMIAPIKDYGLLNLLPRSSL